MNAESIRFSKSLAIGRNIQKLDDAIKSDIESSVSEVRLILDQHFNAKNGRCIVRTRICALRKECIRVAREPDRQRRHGN